MCSDIHKLWSILCWSTFVRNYSLKSSWVWCYKLGAPLSVSPILLCRTSRAPSGWVRSTGDQLCLGHSRTFTECSGSHSFIMMVARLGLSYQKMNLRPSPKSRVLWSRLSGCLCRISLYTAALIFPSTRTDLCLDTTPVSVFRKFLGFHSFLCALTCTVDYEALCWQLCAFPNHVQSAEFTTGGHGSSCRNIWQMISGNKMHLTSILSNILAWISSKPFSVFMAHCRILWWKVCLIHFGIRLYYYKMWNK